VRWSHASFIFGYARKSVSRKKCGVTAKMRRAKRVALDEGGGQPHPAFLPRFLAAASAVRFRSNRSFTMNATQRFLVLIFAGAAVASFGADVAANWSEHCAKCHGEDGKGQTKMGKKLAIADLTDSKVQEKFTDADALKAMKDGLKDKDGKVAMKPIEGVSEADMKLLIGYVRGLKK
jgi:cytochrome c553